MAKSTSFPFPGALRGKLGNLVFRKHGSTIVVYEYNEPKKREPSVKQKQSRERFKAASDYAKKALRNGDLKTQYHIRALEKGKGTAFNIAMSDFLNKPQVRNAELINSRLQIDAIDDFLVERVEVKVVNPSGEVVEQGHAYLLPDKLWYYDLQTGSIGNAVEISITAYDIPGNSDEKILKME